MLIQIAPSDPDHRARLDEAVWARDYIFAVKTLLEDGERNSMSSPFLTLLGNMFFLDAMKKANAQGALEEHSQPSARLGQPPAVCHVVRPGDIRRNAVVAAGNESTFLKERWNDPHDFSFHHASARGDSSLINSP